MIWAVRYTRCPRVKVHPLTLSCHLMQIATDSDSAPEELEKSIDMQANKEPTPVAARATDFLQFLSESSEWSSSETWSSQPEVDGDTSDDSPTSDSDSDCISDQLQLGITKPGRPRAQQGSAADTPANARRRQRAIERKREIQLELEWRQAVCADIRL